MAIKEVPTNIRLPDWEHRLFALIEASKDTPFAWGTFDCCNWAAMCYESVTGKVSKLNSTKRKDEKAALRFIKKMGSMSAILEKELGESVSPKFARRGDICLIEKERASIGVCVGAMVVCVDIDGLVNVPMREVTKAWHI
jgi:hypothetical protein